MRTTLRVILGILMNGRRTSTIAIRPSLRRIVMVAALAVSLVLAGAGPLHAAPQLIQGSTGEGALYEFAVPENWNGVLALYAHGIVSPTLPVALPGGSFIAFRDALLAQGVAVAYSSYSENGFAVKDGEQRTHQLLGLFKSRVGNPEYVYIMGHSLGGTIAMGLAEKHPSQYDGALPMCGFLGGTETELIYIANVRILFDALFPGVIPGEPFAIPPAVAADPLPTLAAVQAALIAGFATGKTQQLFVFASLPGATPTEIVTSGVTAIGFNLIYTNDLVERTRGIPFDNTETDYGVPGWDALDVAADRFTSDRQAMNYIEKYETPTGELQIPMVTMHTSRDPVVPFSHEADYRRTVEVNGATALLRQRTVVAYGHCNFQLSQMIQAFNELRAWAEQGVIPSP